MSLRQYRCLHYHVTWATKGRAALITEEIAELLHGYIKGKVLEMGGVTQAIGGVEDHVHVVLSIPPEMAVAAFIGRLKGSSSHWMTHIAKPGAAFSWQDGYGAFTLGQNALAQVTAYVMNQRDHHNHGNLDEDLEI